ncbi:AraC family transcriptional regulator [Novosphingobium album (ex Hu et al. 2023)]|uniref:AraC family transcriptional regulator n=1 Tax=Novosphingobium album (ex Hu et al. 2023) TaxID=2930093 RepID=A0ABT0B335_9SPHN|nr:AraC family transcriptional regulator [Novosphingobium album (ex Hu et al. 2023)]MCJ2179298.1 AraC family transcriptional regulator [Novosphingobium album (ex Hu et al. 2023)]
MPDKPPKAVSRSLSDLLADVRLSGQTWVYGDFAGQAGCAVAPGDAVFIHAVIHGELRLACTGGAMAELGPGDVAMVLSGEAHALRTAPGARAQPHEGLRRSAGCDVPPAMAFGDGPRVTARVLSGRLQAQWPGDVSRAALPSLLRTGTTLFQSDAMPLSGMGAGSAALLTRIAETLLIAALRADPGCRRILSAETRDPIEDALQLIVASPAQAWTVESLARSVGMGRSNFAAHFTQAVGKAPMEVVAERRMEHAASLLRQGRMKVAEIAEMAGYGSEAAFSRRFSRHFGITPSQMREEARAVREEAVPMPRFRALLAGARSRAVRASENTAEPATTTGTIPSDKIFFTQGRRD